MTTVNVVGHHEPASYPNLMSPLTGFHIRAAIARVAHIEREGITSVRTSASSGLTFPADGTKLTARGP
jgi:hypothetical protein